jgi:hypothetical protein
MINSIIIQIIQFIIYSNVVYHIACLKFNTIKKKNFKIILNHKNKNVFLFD